MATARKHRQRSWKPSIEIPYWVLPQREPLDPRQQRPVGVFFALSEMNSDTTRDSKVTKIRLLLSCFLQFFVVISRQGDALLP